MADPDSILRLPAVKLRTGLSRSTIYAKVARGKFPKPISLGPRAVGWLESEVTQAIEQWVNASRPAVEDEDHKSEV